MEASTSHIGGCSFEAAGTAHSAWNDDFVIAWVESKLRDDYCNESDDGHGQMGGGIEVWMSR